MVQPVEVDVLEGVPARIRILFVAHDVQLHGAQLTLLNILRTLDRSRFIPFVVAPQSGPFTDEVARMGIPVWSALVMRWVFRHNPVTLKSMQGAPWRLLRTPVIFALFLCGFPIRLGSLLLLLHRQRIDVVYTNTVTVVDGAIAAKLFRRPHIWHLHENISATNGLIRVLPARYVAASLTMKLSTCVAVPSSALKDQIFGIQATLSKVKVIPNGVDTNRFSPGTPTHFLHKQLGIPLDAPLVGICGAIQESKGHGTFVKAAAIVSITIPNAHFVVIGEGRQEYLQRLTDLASELGLAGKLHFTGWRSDIPQIFRELQMVVIASMREAFGLTATEGMATGIPVISTRCGGPEEVIQHGISGYVVALGDPVEMAQRIAELLSSAALRNRMGRDGRERAEQSFALRVSMTKVEQLIEQAQSVQHI